jgi:hypothetical protein
MTKVSDKEISDLSIADFSLQWPVKPWRKDRDSQVYIEMIDKLVLMLQLQVKFSVKNLD